MMGSNESNDDTRGFTFPGDFEITAMGSASDEADLKARIPKLLEAAGLTVKHETVRHRESREGAYLAVSVTFHCATRADYERAHEVLRADPYVRYTM